MIYAFVFYYDCVNTNDEKEYENLHGDYDPYYGEEEEVEWDEDIESDGEDNNKDSLTPLWKYVQRLEGGKGGGTTKFTCPHNNNSNTSSHSHVRKHLCGLFLGDENKHIGVKTYNKLPKVHRQIC